MKTNFLPTILFFLLIGTATAQNKQFKEAPIQRCDFIKDVNKGKWLLIEGVKITPKQLCNQYKYCLGLGNNDSLALVAVRKSDSTESRFTVNQFNNGIRVEYGNAYFHTKNGFVYKIKSSFIRAAQIINSNRIDLGLLKTILRKKFSDDIEDYDHASKTFELVLLSSDVSNANNQNLSYAWKVKMDFSNPFKSKIYFFDATSGSILREQAIAKQCATGTGQTAHNGTQTVHTKYNSATADYILLDDCSHTYWSATLHTVENSPNPEYHDADNNWTSSGDMPGIQTHWGAHQVLDYWGSYWGRDSYNNNGGDLTCFNDVNLASFPFISWDGAYWYNPTSTIYLGTGSPTSNYDNWNTLDIIGHEFTHGVNDYEANLIYEKESGALDESFADIFGCALERWVEGASSNNWLMGEERGNPIRSMANPNTYNNPDTKNDQLYWVNTTGCTPTNGNDACGVHTNSGVQNHWFYLLVNGGSGTNDLGYNYNVTGIGFANAIAIAHRNLTYELGPSVYDDYDDARQGSIDAATYLYGASSQQVSSVTQAWCAVGVGTNCSSTTCSTPTGATENSITQTSVYLDWAASTGANSYTVRYRVSGSSSWILAYPTNSNHSLTGLVCNTTYEWQVRTECSNGSSTSYTGSRTFTTSSCGGGGSGDNCSSPIPLTSNTSCSFYTSTVAGATSSGISIPSCSGFTSTTALDVWFSFVAQSTTETILVDPQGTYSGTSDNNYIDPVIALYNSCSSGGIIQCEDDNGGGGGNCEMTVSGLTAFNTYYIRVFDYGSSPPTYGGFDICVYHTPSTSCSTPSNTTETFISQTQADLDWDNASGAASYTLRYRVSGGSWQTVYPSSSYYSLTGLQCNTTYEWQVKTECSNGNSSSYTNTRTFTTNSCGGSLQVDLTQFQQNANLIVNGNTITISETVINNGSSSSVGFEIGYYLSTNSNFSTLDYFLGTDYISGLGAGATSYQDITVDLCSVGIPNGTYYVGYYIDRNNSVSETNEGNNILYWTGGVPVLCGSINQVDLTLNQPNAGFSMNGNTISINEDVINNGSSSSAGFEIGYYLSTSPTFTSLDYFIGSDYVSGLSSGNITSQNISVDLCALGIPDGNYYVGFFIDRTGSVTETNESNNIWYFVNPITIACSTIPQVDLSQYQQNANLSTNGNTISISETVINNGTTSAGSFEIGYYLSTSWNFSSLDYFIGSDYVSGLSSGSTTNQNISVDLCTAGVPDGQYYVGYYIDRFSSVSETDEGNNIWYWGNPITVSCNTACPLPALLVTGTITDNSVDLSWSVVSNISYYTILYKESSSSNWIALTTTSNTYTLSGLNCNTSYDWTVISNCTNGSSSTTGPITTFFTLNCCPTTPPQLSYPWDNSTITGNNITFQWYEVPNASSYLFEISRDLYFNTVEYQTQNPSDFVINGGIVSLGLNTFSQDGTDYYWRVKALGNSCNTSFSTRWNFYSGDCYSTYAPTPILYNPPYGSTQYGDTVYFNWSDVSCMDYTQFQVSQDPNFNSWSSVGDFTSTYYTIWYHWTAFSQPGNVWYWRVRNENSFGWGNWSSNFYFITGGPNAIYNIDDTESKLSIFPNPNSGIFKLLFTNAEIGEYSIRVFDMTGRIIDYRVGNSTAHEIKEDFSIDNLAEGVYVIVFSEKGKTYTTRFSKF